MKKDTNYFERIEIIRQSKGFESVTELAEYLGYAKPEKLYRLKRDGNAKPSADIIEDFTNKFEDLNIRWFITGNGIPFVQNSAVSASSQDVITADKSAPNSGIISVPKSVPNPQILKIEDQINVRRSGASDIPMIHFSSEKENYTPVPIIDLQVAAGGGYLNEEFIVNQAHIDMPNYFLKRGALYFWVKVRGDSMAPTIHDDSLVMIRLMDRGEWANLSKEVVCGVFTKEGVGYLKRIKNRLNKGFVTCMSDNPDKASNPNFNIEIDEIQTLWYAECFLSWRFINVHDQYYSRLQRLEDRFEDMVKLLNK